MLIVYNEFYSFLVIIRTADSDTIPETVHNISNIVNKKGVLFYYVPFYWTITDKRYAILYLTDTSLFMANNKKWEIFFSL